MSSLYNISASHSPYPYSFRPQISSVSSRSQFAQISFGKHNDTPTRRDPLRSAFRRLCCVGFFSLSGLAMMAAGLNSGGVPAGNQSKQTTPPGTALSRQSTTPFKLMSSASPSGVKR